MRWLLVALLFAIPAMAQAPSGLQVDIEGHAFGFGPEAWKDGFAVDDQASFTESASGWSESLGAYLDVQVRAEPRSGSAQNDWDYQAFLTDGNVEVEGLVTLNPTGRFAARFDVDGQRALPGMAAIPALTPGTWTLRVRATTEGSTGDPVPEGSGQTILATEPLPASPPMMGDAPIEGIHVPAAMLPHITEIGPGAIWMNRAPHPGGVPAVFEAGGVGLVWRAFSTDGGGVPALPAGLPGPTISTRWQAEDLVANEGDGRSVASFTAPNETQRVAIVSVVDPVRGGHASWALAVSDAAMSVSGLQAPEPGQEGPVTVSLETPDIDATRLVPGTTYALSLTPDSTTQITSSPIVPTSRTTAAAILDGSALRSHQGPYRTVSMLLADGGYGGHVVMDRGLDVAMGLPALGAGTPAKLILTLSSLSEDGRTERNAALQTVGTVTVTIGSIEQVHDVQILEGGSIAVVVPFTPTAAGLITIQALVDTGDTYTLIERSEQVLDAETFAQEHEPWYNPGKYVPGPPLAAVLLGLVLLGRKR